MTTQPLRSVTPAIDTYIKLAQYPILADEIRARMREELFRRGVISQPEFENEVKKKASESLRREGLLDPFGEEPTTQWQLRKERIRAFQTDAYFSNNLGSQLLDQIIQEVLNNKNAEAHSLRLAFNPEVAPWDLLFRQGEIYENLPPLEREEVSHHLEEIKVVLIKRLISEQLPFIAVARKVFSIGDLRRIYRRRIGRGKIGGKAAGMTLAWKILQQQNPEFGPDISEQVEIPESWFIGTEVIYDFRLANEMDHFMNQKYRPLAEIRKDYPDIVQAHLDGDFPEEIVEQIAEVLEQVGNSPLIVRSSSLLEDNFGYSFAGKYYSYFCPNQGTPEGNLHNLLQAIKRVYASTVNPDALLYRQHHGLIDYDERMAILLQKLEGARYGRYFFPTAAGVAFSQNPFRWNPKIRREDGFLRLVWGMGTRAVDRVDKDYPRMISLSHPQLRPETTPTAIRQYSQWLVDVIDMEANEFKTLPISDVLTPEFPFLRQIASIDKGDYLQDILSAGGLMGDERFVLTFNGLTKDRKFIKLMRTALMRLERVYKRPVDVEYAVEIIPNYPYPDYKLHLLQCRPLSQREKEEQVAIPRNVPASDTLFTSCDLIPEGKAEGVRYIIYVDPVKYHQIADTTVKLELGRAIGRLNKLLEDESFILMGPGRWGSTNLELGVKVSYADIYNTKVLVEMAVAHDGRVPELSYGTHFYQDLVEANIYSLPLHIGVGNGVFNWAFFQESPNSLARLLPDDADLGDYLRVIDVALLPGNRRLHVLMDGRNDEAIGYLAKGNWQAVNLNKNEGSVSSF